MTLLRKVFLFLEKWGLINYGASLNVNDSKGENFISDDVKWKVKIEEGAPNGIRVVATPNSVKPISLEGFRSEGGVVGDVVRLPSLASYSDVFGDSKKDVLACGVCSEKCDSSYYKCATQVISVLFFSVFLLCFGYCFVHLAIMIYLVFPKTSGIY